MDGPESCWWRKDIFEKAFIFEKADSAWLLPKLLSPAHLLCWKNDDLYKIKQELLDIKSELNALPLAEWHKHTTKYNPAGEVQYYLKRNFGPELCSQAWTKFRELLPRLGLSKLVTRTPQFVSVHLCEAPGAFVTSLNHYLCNIEYDGEWKWLANTLNPYYEGNDENSMISDDRLIQDTMKNWSFGSDGTGDIMNLENIFHIKQQATDLGDVLLVTADGSINCVDSPGEQEDLTACLHFCETVAALTMLKAGGSFLLKRFTLVEASSICMMYLLNCFFDKVTVVKPATSKHGNSEVYVVCVGFRGVETQILDQLHDLVEKVLLHPKQMPAFIRKTDMPSTFISQHISCVKKFTALQIDAIENNLRNFRKPQLSDKTLREIKQTVNKAFVERFHVAPIVEKRKVVTSRSGRAQENAGRQRVQNSFEQRRSEKERSWEERVSSMTSPDVVQDSPPAWLESTMPPEEADFESIGAIQGKRLTELMTSRFCSQDVLQLYKDIMTHAENNDADYSDDRYLKNIVNLCNSVTKERLNTVTVNTETNKSHWFIQIKKLLAFTQKATTVEGSDSESDQPPAKRQRAIDDEDEPMSELQIYHLSADELKADVAMETCRLCFSLVSRDNKSIQCTGLCQKLFHLQCASKENAGLKGKKTSFRCDRCSADVPPCFICNETTGEVPIQCSVKFCAHHYHVGCLEEHPFYQKSKSGVVCPQHRCHTCVVADAADCGQTKDNLLKCLRCPTAFHGGQFCVSAGSTVREKSSKHAAAQKKTQKQINVNFCFACGLGGKLIICDFCPGCYHEDCLRSYELPSAGSSEYRCPTCREERPILFGDILWVKMGSYRWWPAEVKHPLNCSVAVQNTQRDTGDICVRFFGTNDFVWTPPRRSFHFMAGDLGYTPAEASSNKALQAGFKKGVEDASRAFRIVMEERSRMRGNLNSLVLEGSEAENRDRLIIPKRRATGNKKGTFTKLVCVSNESHDLFLDLLYALDTLRCGDILLLQIQTILTRFTCGLIWILHRLFHKVCITPPPDGVAPFQHVVAARYYGAPSTLLKSLTRVLDSCISCSTQQNKDVLELIPIDRLTDGQFFDYVTASNDVFMKRRIGCLLRHEKQRLATEKEANRVTEGDASATEEAVDSDEVSVAVVTDLTPSGVKKPRDETQILDLNEKEKEIINEFSDEISEFADNEDEEIPAETIAVTKDIVKDVLSNSTVEKATEPSTFGATEAPMVSQQHEAADDFNETADLSLEVEEMDDVAEENLIEDVDAEHVESLAVAVDKNTNEPHNG